jgi:hypothetical protein
MKRPITALFAVMFAAALALAAPSTQPAAHVYPLKADVVSGEPLGDKAIVETVAGREVHFASADTAAKFKAGGDEMQKKMDDQIIAATKDSYALKTCIVSDEALGGDMGAPIFYVNRPTNQLVEFCCASCPKKFKKDPATYLPKLDAATK